MWAYRVFSSAMSQIGKPISRLEDIARYLRADAEQAPHAAWPLDRPTDSRDDQRMVYAGAPIAIEQDELIFDAAPLVTTRMDFAPDELGYLVNGDGLVLMGHADDGPDPAGGLRLQPIRLDDGPVMPPRATTTIRYKANLPKTPLETVSGKDLAEVEPDEAASHALSGGEIGLFDMRGRAITVRLRWAQLGEDRWRLLFRVMGNALAVRAAGRGWQVAGQDFVFDARGRLRQAEPVTLDLGRGHDPVTLDFGRCGLTQFPDSTGLVRVLACSQNGWAQAELREVAVREDGRVLGCFDNGRVGLLGVAAFANAPAYGGLRDAA